MITLDRFYYAAVEDLNGVAGSGDNLLGHWFVTDLHGRILLWVDRYGMHPRHSHLESKARALHQERFAHLELRQIPQVFIPHCPRPWLIGHVAEILTAADETARPDESACA